MFVPLLIALVASSTGLKPVFDSPYQNATLEYGRWQFLMCKAEGETPITYKWHNGDGEEITGDREKPIYVSKYELSSFLNFNKTSTEHEGSYTCTASNAHGLASKVFFLRVLPPNGLKPTFDSPTENATLESGTVQLLRCQAEGEKPITYKWYNQDGDEITEDTENTVFVSKGELLSFLVFNGTSTEHEGTYTCTASNANGQANKVFFIRVPSPGDGNDTNIDQGNGTSRFRDANVLKYTTRSVTFYITTTGPVKYILAKYSEGARAFNATTSTIRLDPVRGNIYEIGNLLPSGFYIFQFRTVPSEIDDWSREYNVTLLSGAPEIILQNIGDRNVKLQWFTSTDDNFRGTIDKHQIKYFSVEMVDGSTWTSTNCSVTTEVPTCLGSSYTIWGLERTIFYQIEVRAHTEAGYGEPWRQKVYLP